MSRYGEEKEKKKKDVGGLRVLVPQRNIGKVFNNNNNNNCVKYKTHQLKCSDYKFFLKKWHENLKNDKH